MPKKADALQKRWWIVAAVIGVTTIAASQIMKPKGSEAPEGTTMSSSSVNGVHILPAAPLTFHALRIGGDLAQAAQVGGFSGIDAEATPRTIVWSVDGREVHRGPELDPSRFRRGNTVEARVQEVRSDGSAHVNGIATAKIGNARPQIQSVTVQRDRDDPRWLQAHVRTVDADDDPLTLEYRWTSDGQPVRHAQGSRVSTDGLEPGQKIRVEVTVSDGDLRSEPFASTPTELDNRAPQLEIPGTPRMERLENGDLIAHMGVGCSDADGDLVRVEVVEAPTGFHWDATEKCLVWAIESGEEVVDVTLRVTDARGASAERRMKVRR
jgi:hypothetical protein